MEILKEIKNKMKLNLDDFEPTDSEGRAMEGSAEYGVNNYYVFLSADNDKSYERQAAEQILEAITRETYEAMGKLHLCAYTRGGTEVTWEILEEGCDYIGAMHDGKVSHLYTKDVCQADTLPELLRTLQKTDDNFKWYVVTDFIDARRQTRRTEYPHHREIHLLKGFVPDVCWPRKENSYLTEWSVRYVRELWYAASDERMVKVRGFEEKADRATELYIAFNGLKYEDNAE